MLIKFLSEAGRKELMEGSLTARACVGLQGSGWKSKERSRWVRLKKRSGASEVELCGDPWRIATRPGRAGMRSHLNAEASSSLLPAPTTSSCTEGGP